MEKVTSNSYSQASSASQILDLSKNINVKVDTNSGANFKDYVKSSNESNNYESKKDTKFEKNNVKEKNTDNDVKDTRIKKDDTPKEVRTEKKDDSVKNTSDIKDNNSKVESKKVEEEPSDESEVKDVQKTELKEDTSVVDEQSQKDMQAILATMLNINEEPKVVRESLEEVVTSEVANKLIEQINNNKEIPKELKTQLTDLLKNVSKDGKIDLSKLIEVMKPENLEQIPELKNVDVKDLFKKVLDSAKEDTKRELQSQQIDSTNIPKININQELNNLKNEMNMFQNGKQTENVQENIEVEDNINPIFTGDGLTNVKIIGMNTKIFTQNVRTAMNSEQIQNFSKIVDEMRLAFKDDKTMLTIKLEPETLGKLSVKINSENGIFNASFNVESEKAKQAIEAQIHVLRQALADQGINIQDINVQVGQNNEDLNYHQNIIQAINFSKKGGSRLSLDGETFEETMNPYMASDDIFNDLI